MQAPNVFNLGVKECVAPSWKFIAIFRGVTTSLFRGELAVHITPPCLRQRRRNCRSRGGQGQAKLPLSLAPVQPVGRRGNEAATPYLGLGWCRCSCARDPRDCRMPRISRRETSRRRVRVSVGRRGAAKLSHHFMMIWYRVIKNGWIGLP